MKKTMKKLFSKSKDATVAGDVTSQVDQARQLIGIDDQELLDDPRTNPATRGRADALRIQQQLAALDQQHSRALRRGRVRDSRAAAAERTLEAIQAAREETSPGRAVGTLSITRSRAMAGCLAFSIVLSVGSGMAIDTWLQGLESEQPQGLGYIVEGGMTVLATSMIVLRGRLAARNTELEPWQHVTFWALIGVPLIASAILASMGSPVGAFCSIGAAAWSVAAYLASTSLSTAITDALEEVRDSDEAELRRIALGEEDPVEESAPRQGSATTWVTDQSAVMTDQIEAFLADQDGPDDGGVQEGHTDPTPTGPTPSASHGLPRDEVRAAWARQKVQIGGHIDSDQHERDDRSEGDPDVTPAIRARQAAGAQTRDRIEQHLERYPSDTQAQIAAAVGVSESTVKRHLRVLRGGN